MIRGLRPLVVSHRTQMGTAPENTLAGIDAALADGVDGIEIDVRATADGALVLLHDDTLERTVEDPRRLADVERAELHALAVRDPYGRLGAQPIPTLEEALERIDGRAILVIELKEHGLEERVAALVRAREAASWCWIWCFMPEVVAAAREVLPEVPGWLNWSARTAELRGAADPVEVARRIGAAGISVQHGDVDAGLVERARRRGLLTATWTVNERADLERVRDAGVDAICGDFPDRTIAALSA